MLHFEQNRFLADILMLKSLSGILHDTGYKVIPF